MLFRFLFGDDIFISYSRRDGANYAAALANELSRPGRDFSCFLDQWGASAANELSKPVLRAIKRSSVLVLVGTAGAAASPMVRQEIKMFSQQNWLRAHRPILPININAALSEVSWAELTGLHRTAETEEARADGLPSDAVVRLITNSHSYTRRNQRVRWLSVGATIPLIASIAAGAAAVWQSRLARDAQRKAITAAEQERVANENRVQAEADTAKAQLQERVANENRAKAENETKEAQKQTLIAEANVARQREIASSLQLANQAESIRGDTSPTLTLSSFLAAESLQLHRSLEGDRALRNSLALLPELSQKINLPGAAKNKTIAVSSDGKYFAVESFDKVIRVLDVASGRQVGQLPNDFYCLTALSEGGKYVALASNKKVQLWEKNEGTYQKIVDFPANLAETIGKVAISPDGRYLAAIRSSSDDGFQFVWKFDREKRSLTKLGLDGFVESTQNVSFSSDGKFLILTGVERSDDNSKYSKARVYEVPDPETETNSAERTQNCDQSPFREITTIGRQFSFIPEAAVSADLGNFGFYVAIAQTDTISVLECNILRTSYREVARVPFKGDDIGALVFTDGGKSLSVFDKEKNASEVWSISAHTGMEHYGVISSIALSDNGRGLVTAAPVLSEAEQADAIKFLDVTSNKKRKLVPEGYDGTLLALSPDAKYVVTQGEGGGPFLIWDLTSGKLVPGAPFNNGSTDSGALALSPLRKYLASAGRNGDVYTLSLMRLVNQEYKLTQRKHFTEAINAMSFSPDGQYLAVLEHEITSDKSTVYILKTATLRTVTVLPFDDSLQMVALSSNGRFLATASGAVTKIWEVSVRRQISVIEERLPVRAAAFSKDGGYIAIASGQDTAGGLPTNFSRIWPFDPREIIKDVYSRLSHTKITETVCRRYLGSTLPRSYCKGPFIDGERTQNNGAANR